MIAEKQWKLRERKFSKYKVSQIKKLGFSKNMAEILLLRGLDTKESINNFLNCSLKDFHEPMLLPDIQKFIDRVQLAIEKKERVLIYGDYDADGTISASVLTRALKRIGMTNIMTMAPHRKLGYGLKEKVVTGVAKHGFSLIITCDCGSSDAKEIELAKTLGIDVMVVDHHEVIHDIHPLAFINPKRKDSLYPFDGLCGAGVVFKIVQALERIYPQLSAIRCLDYIAIATVADVSPLIGENRIIVKFGMERLSNTKNVPLASLMSVLSLTGRKVTSEMIGFIIGPRFNAPGRISSANITIKFLLSDDSDFCKKTFIKIKQINERRKLIEAQIKEDAMRLLSDKLEDKVIVLSSRDWNKGVIGIVASVVCQYYTRPTILIAVESNGYGYGSARNIEEFPLLESFESCKSLLKGFGGHSMAAGLTIKEENIDEFRKQINEFADKVLSDDMLIPSAKADLILDEKEITHDFVQELKKLEPFGNQNHLPLFILQDVMISSYKVYNRHLYLTITRGSKTLNSRAFWMSEYEQLIKDEVQEYDILFELSSKIYGTGMTIQLLLEDLKECKLA